MAMDANALPEVYTIWAHGNPNAAHVIFERIARDADLREKAKPIWQTLQSRLYDEFAGVEARMQCYLNDGDFAGLQKYTNEYIYRTSQEAYDQALRIIEKKEE
jgi:hypothetical protein